MERGEILKVIEKHLAKSVPGIAAGIDPEKKFTDYGANSLDIVEIVSGSMRELKVKIPRTELSDIQNISGLIDKFEAFAPKTA
ncbi:phosphopantetheine-binding protein [Aurantibacillus circumpalustris]|uniref:phosphopantetheine-binding protein n=1 Tax=Aurantibacillus circumpalustris TaxID=3036359 RepID=UPI00295BC1C7|nr:phosphopantetheine-binding protein [Aurantibacillus circumpalustris]